MRERMRHDGLRFGGPAQGIRGPYQFSIDLGAIADDGVVLVHEDDRNGDLAPPEFRELRAQHLKPQLHVGGKSWGPAMGRSQVATRVSAAKGGVGVDALNRTYHQIGWPRCLQLRRQLPG